jgi:hypothetical protein
MAKREVMGITIERVAEEGGTAIFDGYNRRIAADGNLILAGCASLGKVARCLNGRETTCFIVY